MSVKRYRTSDNMIEVGTKGMVFGPDSRDDFYVQASDYAALAARLAKAEAALREIISASCELGTDAGHPGIEKIARAALADEPKGS